MPRTNTILATDGYKFSMAQAGFPMRPETFYLSFRRGGWQYIPFDLEAEVRAMLPANSLNDQLQFLDQHGYGMSRAMTQALESGALRIKAAPARSWVYEREPILTISGPSFLVSWLEPHVLRLFYPIQLATLLKTRSREELATAVVDPSGWLRAALDCTCEEQADIARRVIDAVGATDVAQHVKVKTDKFRSWLTDRVQRLLAIVEDPNRIFEVGMRAASCEEQHRIALEVCREAGIRATSNVGLASDLGMTPIGTMGHEHIQRWGNDLDAYRAMRDMRVGAPSYLLDTFDTIRSGIPTAIRVMLEREHAASIRYDSGDKFGQYIYAHGEFKRHGLEPTHIIEDGLTDSETAKFERLREHTELAPSKQLYGYGGYLVGRGWNGIDRDTVAAVYKLTETSGEPRMKFGNEKGLGKMSVPGHPVIWRRLRGSGPVSIIGQDGELVPENYVCLSGDPNALDQLSLCNAKGPSNEEVPYVLSPATENLVNRCSTNARS